MSGDVANPMWIGPPPVNSHLLHVAAPVMVCVTLVAAVWSVTAIAIAVVRGTCVSGQQVRLTVAVVVLAAAAMGCLASALLLTAT